LIDVSELHALTKHDQQTLNDIEEIFRALVGYPGEEELKNSTRADRVGAFAAACESLIGDTNIMPGNISELVRRRLGGADALVAQTYGAAVEAISENPDPFIAILKS
jgi:hypothetical protein